MTVKQYLMQIRMLDKQIDSKLENLQNLRSKVCQVTASYSMQPGSSSPTGDKMASLIAKIIDLEREITDEIDAYADLKEGVMDSINRIDNPVLKLVLILRYINQLQWRDISAKMNYDISWIFRLHQKALAELEYIDLEVQNNTK